MRPYTDVDAASAVRKRGVITHDHGGYIAAQGLWRKAADAGQVGARRNLDELSKPSQQEPANP